ncbi:MAG: HAMP domain-containing histidine kinase [Ignavibacteriales bacterium]|nr:HAMP domain-containing histidine kinase [Ignavibacteriales bacterium]
MNIKLVLLVIALVITAGTFYYTQYLVNDLQKSERQIVELYANTLEFIANPNSDNNTDLTFIFENIIKRINFPLMLTDAHGVPMNYEIGSGIKNIEIDSTWDEAELVTFLKDKVNELASIHEPINVSYKDAKGKERIFNKIYFGNSDLIQKLKYYPFLQVLFAILFLVLSYVSFSYVKRNEQSNIWVGMAKEIAHQLGTPISSLMGWTELLKMKINKPDEVLSVAEEMESDLSRLNKITNRFSKIGSKPILKPNDLNEVLESVVKYFEKRLPQTGKDVQLIYSNGTSIKYNMNASLFEWVIENLIKNAIDAIGSDKGKILVTLEEKENTIEIEVADNGKGINPKNRKDIFRPGYSTKSRGWGLGLSLSKRIVEDYHKGKLILKSSILNEGTIFLIILNKNISKILEKKYE